MLKKLETYFLENTEKKLFLWALCTRVLFLVLNLGDWQNYQAPDSVMYIKIAQDIANGLGYNDPERLPIYGSIFGLFTLLFGKFSIAAMLFFQVVIDSVTVVLFYKIAGIFSSKVAWLIGLITIFNTNLIVHSGLILTDTLFIFFLTLFLLNYLKILKNESMKSLIWAFFFLGLATLVKPITQFLIYCAPIYLMLFLFSKKKPKKAISFLILSILTSQILISPWLFRNHQKYGAWEFTSQKGVNIMSWYLPLIRSYSKGSSWESEVAITRLEFEDFIDRKGISLDGLNAFEISAHQVEAGKELLLKEKPLNILNAWIRGSVLNIFAPGITSAALLVNMKRPGFYNSKGDSFLGKLFNFLFHRDNRLYLFLMIPSVAGLLIFRFLQVLSVYELGKGSRLYFGASLFMFCYLLYFLALTGPVVNASRYRLPIEICFALILIPIFDRFYERFFSRSRSL